MKLGDPNNIKEYLGDSVYAEFDGFELALYLDNGYGPHDIIFLEPQVFDALLNYAQKIKNWRV